MPRTVRIEPAYVAWAVILTGGLTTTGTLIRKGYRSLSDVAGGSWPARALVTYFFVHFMARMLPQSVRNRDPLHRIADRLRPVAVREM